MNLFGKSTSFFNLCLTIALFYVPIAAAPTAPTQSTTAQNADSPANLATVKRLGQNFKLLIMDGQGLGLTLDYFGNEARVKLDVHWEAINAAGIDAKPKLKVQMENVPASDVLSTILSNASTKTAPLDYVVANGTIIISTRKDLEALGYHVKPLAAAASSQPSNTHAKPTSQPRTP